MQSFSQKDYHNVATLLGRPPIGLEAIMHRDQEGMPSVIRVRTLIDNKPFPTLFWLVDKRLCYTLDGLEAQGTIQILQQALNQSLSMQAALEQNHLDYIALRDQFICERDQEIIRAKGFDRILAKRGIGGIENFASIRCLHTYYAAHLICPNVVGQWLDERYLK